LIHILGQKMIKGGFEIQYYVLHLSFVRPPVVHL
jgi:hypothetical protein